MGAVILLSSAQEVISRVLAGEGPRIISSLSGLMAEFLKMQRSWLLWLHLLIPFLGITIFLWYYSASGWNEWGKIAGYMEVVFVICPTMAGVICGLASEQGKQAGHMQNLLGLTKSRWRSMSTKIVVLLLCNLFAILMTVVGYDRESDLSAITEHVKNIRCGSADLRG